MLDLEVIDDPATAVVALDPVRARLLAELVEPGSAASLAPRMGLARQKLNYHLRALEAHGLVRPVEERRWGGWSSADWSPPPRRSSSHPRRSGKQRTTPTARRTGFLPAT
jgi:DNA-binding transcriptional ArsR family regulator